MTQETPEQPPEVSGKPSQKPPKRKSRLLRWILTLSVLAVIGAVTAFGGILYIFYHYGRDLPDYQVLAHYEPPVATRVYAANGQLIAQYAREDRLFLPVSAMPKNVINAFLVAEDKNFYHHGGVDFTGIARAALFDLRHLGTDRRPVGASTITQQVAKNFLLTNEVSIERKIKEAILAFRIERAFSKNQILELYLNEIYLGMGSYGVASASEAYFDKPLNELTLPEAAYLAALPKAPNNYNPFYHEAAALDRRNWVIGRLHEEGYITAEEAKAAQAEPLGVKKKSDTLTVTAAYFTEEVRRFLADRYGTDMLYDGGLQVFTTLDPKLQAYAEKSLRNGLIAYDQTHGWRGPIRKIRVDAWQEDLNVLNVPLGVPTWRLAAVLDVADDHAVIGLRDGTTGTIPFEQMKWARKNLPDQRFGLPPKSVSDVLEKGDVIAVEKVKDDAADETYALRQVPDVGGALVALDPHSGRVRALVGGFDYDSSQFNRATQAQRQPGSAFKPFVYAAALEDGFTPSSLVLDAPFVLDQGPGLPKWKPDNYSHDYYGPSTLRRGIEKSRNLMTVRLAQNIGMDRVVDISRRFGIDDHLQPLLSMSLGAGETTVLKLANAYGMLDNGGKKITPALIERIQDRRGRTIYKRDTRPCPGCSNVAWQGPTTREPMLTDDRERVLEATVAYQITSMMEGVIERGTGVGARSIGKPVAGKTGTSDDAFDAWFMGYSPNLVCGVFVGFDQPRTLGPNEQGATVAVPIFRDFMTEALSDQPSVPFAVPPGIRLVRVNHDTGRPAKPGDTNVILEAFRTDMKVSRPDRSVLDGSSEVVQSETSRRSSTGGIY
jgi:penicillin-binding protein 1A